MITNRRYYRKTGGLFFVLLLMLISVGCESLDSQRRNEGLESSSPTVRIMAIKQVGDSKDSSAVPQLVDCLQSDDESVRFYAVGALRRITGTDRGYDYKASPKSRGGAIKRWREFLGSNGVTE